MFSGDAIGSGDDVWLFDYESFPKYEKSIHRLIQYICDPANGINKEELTIFGGHYWQKGDLESLKVDYVYDMKILVQKIGEGTAESKELKTFLPFLNVSFKYESAGIAWNRDAARQYQASLSNP